MSDCYIYDVYKPKTHKLPFDFEAKFRYVHRVAIKLLDRFTEQQLIDATRRLDRAVLDSDVYWYRITMEDWEDPDSAADYSDTKDAFLHFAMQKQLDMSDLLGLDNVTWAECYALGGISLVAYAARLELYQFRQQAESKGKSNDPNRCPTEIMLEEMAKKAGGSVEHDYQLHYQWNIAEYAVESSKLAAVAITLSASLFSDEDYKKLRQRQTAKGGVKRAQRFLALKELVLKRYMAEHTHRSNRNAAKRIYESLPPEDLLAADGRPVLTTDDPVKRLSEWIGKDKSSRKQAADG